MLRYTLRRLASAVPTVFIIVTLTFFMIRLAPGGPFDLERPLDPLIMENLKRAYNLDGSLWSQYLTYMGNLMQGDLGPSFTKRDFTVNDLFASGLPISMLLGGLAISLAVAIGTILGAIAALRQNSWLDYTIVGLATFGITTPNFVVAPLLSLFFGVILRWLPAGGWSSSDPTYWVLPVVTLALPQVAVIARLVRGATIEALRSNHVRTARAYGLPARTVVVKHALRAAMLPAVSYLGPTAAGLPDRLGRGRDDLRPARHRTLLRAGRARTRLHARDGDRGGHCPLHPALQPDRGPALHAPRPAGAL